MHSLDFLKFNHLQICLYILFDALQNCKFLFFNLKHFQKLWRIQTIFTLSLRIYISSNHFHQIIITQFFHPFSLIFLQYIVHMYKHNSVARILIGPFISCQLFLRDNFFENLPKLVETIFTSVVIPNFLKGTLSI